MPCRPTAPPVRAASSRRARRYPLTKIDLRDGADAGRVGRQRRPHRIVRGVHASGAGQADDVLSEDTSLPTSCATRPDVAAAVRTGGGANHSTTDPGFLPPAALRPRWPRRRGRVRPGPTSGAPRPTRRTRERHRRRAHRTTGQVAATRPRLPCPSAASPGGADDRAPARSRLGLVALVLGPGRLLWWAGADERHRRGASDDVSRRGSPHLRVLRRRSNAPDGGGPRPGGSRSVGGPCGRAPVIEAGSRYWACSCSPSRCASSRSPPLSRVVTRQASTVASATTSPTNRRGSAATSPR